MDEINNKFIDDLRLYYDIINFIFDNDQTEIVPEKFTHKYLLKHFSIHGSILKYYFLSTSKLLSDDEFQKMKNSGFIGYKESALCPYSISIYGAYYSRSDIISKLQGLIGYPQKITINGIIIKYFHDLIPYFIEYGKGFQQGFDEFENIQIIPFLTRFSDKQDYVYKVFEYITKRIAFEHDWTNNGGFKFCSNGNETTIIDAFNDGEKQGYFYRAWSIIFSNNLDFAPLFQNYYESMTTLQIETKTTPIPIFKAEIVQNVFDTLKDFFNSKDQIELKQILETGNNTRAKLLFNGKGNKLLDTFKKLIEHQLIMGCSKQDLQEWIITNFSFLQSNTAKEFKPDTVEKTISRNGYPCKNPLIEIRNGEIQKSTIPRSKK